MDYLNFSCSTQNIFSLESSNLVFDHVNSTDSFYSTENTPDEIAEIVSDKVIDVIRRQFETIEKTITEN